MFCAGPIPTSSWNNRAPREGGRHVGVLTDLQQHTKFVTDARETSLARH
jgi:hypothetical protein